MPLTAHPLIHWDKDNNKYQYYYMNLSLIQGEFSPQDALDLISRMIQIKIEYHETRIHKELTEEDIKFRETKIRNLQNELHLLRNHLNTDHKMLSVHAQITIE